MSAREAVVVSHKIPADGGQSPNEYLGATTVEIRVYVPPVTLLNYVDAVAELEAAYWEARRAVEDNYAARCASISRTVT